MVQFVPPYIENEQIVNLGSKIAENAIAFAEKPAVIVSDHVTTWAEFGSMVAQVAGCLGTHGIGKGDFIATLSENSLENLVVFCATLTVGACIVPLPYSATTEALVLMAKDSGSKMIFASESYFDVARDLGIEKIVPLETLFDWAEGAEPMSASDIGPEDLFNIIYSSGTTGLPKGIIHDHRFRSRQGGRMARFGMTSETRILISTPIYSNTTLFAMLPAIRFGATLVLMPKFNTVRFLELSQQYAITHAMCVPVQYMRLMAEPRFEEFDLASYEMKFSTSAPLPAELIAKVMERWPGNLIEVYGMTEGGVATALNCAEWPDKWHTVGKAGDGVDMRVIDEAGNELPQGSYGEIVGRAPSIMPGYHNVPEKTKEVMWIDKDGHHFLRSGDMGRIDEDGFVHLLDRKKDMIISGGFNIYATDLEAVLRQHPDVTDTAVIAIPSETWGETPLGFAVVKEGAQVTAQDLCSWANDRLGKTQRLSDVIVLDTLPRSEIGKILKKDLRDQYGQ